MGGQQSALTACCSGADVARHVKNGRETPPPEAREEEKSGPTSKPQQEGLPASIGGKVIDFSFETRSIPNVIVTFAELIASL